MTRDEFPIGQRIKLPGHFPEPVILEGVRAIGEGFECRVRLLGGTPDEAKREVVRYFDIPADAIVNAAKSAASI